MIIFNDLFITKYKIKYKFPKQNHPCLGKISAQKKKSLGKIFAVNLHWKLNQYTVQNHLQSRLHILCSATQSRTTSTTIEETLECSKTTFYFFWQSKTTFYVFGYLYSISHNATLYQNLRSNFFLLNTKFQSEWKTRRKLATCLILEQTWLKSMKDVLWE